MKYLLHTTAPVWTTIEADNLRGEPRWERAVLGALVKSGAQIHTTDKIVTIIRHVGTEQNNLQAIY